MSVSASEALLAKIERVELYEPELGAALRDSPRLQSLLAGSAQLQAWDAGSLTFLYSQSHQAAFDHLLARLQLPAPLHAAMGRREQASRQDYYWHWDFNDRVERVTVEPGAIETAFVTKRGPNRLRLTVAPLADGEREAALDWLSRPDILKAIAEGKAVDPAAQADIGLVPEWSQCSLAASSTARDVFEAGLHFICRALVVHSTFLPILRALTGEAVLHRCLDRELARRQADFEAACRGIPANRAEFWGAPAALPEVELPLEPAEPGLGAYLPPPDFWPKPADNQLLAETLAKVYRNIPRKLARLVAPRKTD